MSSPEETPTPVALPPKENKVKNFVIKHIFSVIFLALAVLIYIWFSVKLNKAENKKTDEVKQQTAHYETMMDSISVANIKLTTKVLSWAVRGELIRNNIEHIDLFFNRFVKENNIKRLDLIDPNTKVIIKSTDKKIEGDLIQDNTVFTLSNNGVYLDTANAKVISPVMGLDSKIGVLIVSLQKKK